MIISNLGKLISICIRRKDLREFSQVKKFLEINRQARIGLWRIELKTGFMFRPKK